MAKWDGLCVHCVCLLFVLPGISLLGGGRRRPRWSQKTSKSRLELGDLEVWWSSGLEAFVYARYPTGARQGQGAKGTSAAASS